MLIRLTWTIDHECIFTIRIVIFVLNLLRVQEDLSNINQGMSTPIFSSMLSHMVHIWRHQCIPRLYQYIDLDLDHHISVYLIMFNIILIHFQHTPSLWLDIFIKLWFIYWYKFNRILKFYFIWLVIVLKIFSSINLSSLFIIITQIWSLILYFEKIEKMYYYHKRNFTCQ